VLRPVVVGPADDALIAAYPGLQFRRGQPALVEGHPANRLKR
jgi:hypothetical protein